MQIKEVPVQKKNEALAETAGMTEKQKKIADLKKSLLAPLVNKKPTNAPQKSSGGNGPIAVTAGMEDKFKRVMDWGTPRVVTNKRQFNMEGKQDSRNLLLKFATVRNGPVADQPTDKK